GDPLDVVGIGTAAVGERVVRDPAPILDVLHPDHREGQLLPDLAPGVVATEQGQALGARDEVVERPAVPVDVSVAEVVHVTTSSCTAPPRPTRPAARTDRRAR